MHRRAIGNPHNPIELHPITQHLVNLIDVPHLRRQNVQHRRAIDNAKVVQSTVDIIAQVLHPRGGDGGHAFLIVGVFDSRRAGVCKNTRIQDTNSHTVVSSGDDTRSLQYPPLFQALFRSNGCFGWWRGGALVKGVLG